MMKLSDIALPPKVGDVVAVVAQDWANYGGQCDPRIHEFRVSEGTIYGQVVQVYEDKGISA